MQKIVPKLFFIFLLPLLLQRFQICRVSCFLRLKPSFNYLSIYLSIHLSIYLSIYLSTYLSIYLSIYPSICASICLSICLFIYSFIHYSILSSIKLIYSMLLATFRPLCYCNLHSHLL